MKKRRFIINTITHWEEPPRARHQVAQALAKEHEVLFVTANKIGFPRLLKSEICKNLIILSPFFPINYKIRIRISYLNMLYQAWLYRMLKRRYPDCIVVNFDFTAGILHRYFPHNIYYCNDDHVGLSYRQNRQWIARYHDLCEKRVINAAAFCIGTSGFLVNKMSISNPRSYEIRLGAPHVNNDQLASVSTFRNKSETVRVGIVGFVRTINKEILDFLLSKHDLHITLVGPISREERSKLNHHQNMRITGTLTGGALLEEVGGFDVGLIPYAMKNPIDRTPNKLWLYLAMGKPVVISDIKGIRDWKFPDYFVYRSDSYEAFYKLIKKARSENTDKLAQSRINFARENTWEVRMSDFMRILDSIIPFD